MQEFTKDFDGPLHIIQLKNHNYTTEHTHQYLEFVYIMSGSATHKIGDTTSTIKSGDYFVIDYKTSHTYVSENQDLDILNCLFLPELIDPAFAGLKSFNELIQRYFFRIAGRSVRAPTANQIFRDNGTVRALFQKMAKELNGKNDGYLEYARLLLCQILLETVRQVGSNNEPSKPIRAILEQVEKDFFKPLTLRSLCDAVHYSLPYISARFKAEIGVSFTEYLQSRRIDRACSLLGETNQSIAEIAASVGYENLKFFRQIFHKTVGMSPREFRKSKYR